MSVSETVPTTLQAKVADFLAQRRIAIAGISCTRDVLANTFFRRFKAAGYEVVPVSLHGSTFEGETCYPDLRSIPGGADGVLLVTRPEVSAELVRQCSAAGIRRVWMHQSFSRSGTSVSQEAVDFCEANGIMVIAGACPLMFGKTADAGHKCIRWFMQMTGSMPR